MRGHFRSMPGLHLHHEPELPHYQDLEAHRQPTAPHSCTLTIGREVEPLTIFAPSWDALRTFLMDCVNAVNDAEEDERLARHLDEVTEEARDNLAEVTHEGDLREGDRVGRFTPLATLPATGDYIRVVNGDRILALGRLTDLATTPTGAWIIMLGEGALRFVIGTFTRQPHPSVTWDAEMA